VLAQLCCEHSANPLNAATCLTSRCIFVTGTPHRSVPAVGPLPPMARSKAAAVVNWLSKSTSALPARSGHPVVTTTATELPAGKIEVV